MPAAIKMDATMIKELTGATATVSTFATVVGQPNTPEGNKNRKKYKKINKQAL